MPMYDFECPKGHRTEHLLSISAFVEKGEKVECGFEGCTEAGEYRPSFWYTHPTHAQRFSPIVVHRDAAGNVRFPAHADAPIPPGFQKVELTDFHQVRKFEKEMNDRDAAKAQQFTHTRQQFLDGQLKENRRVMEQLVSKFTPRGRKFYEKMREVSEMRRLKGRNDAKPSFYVEALSMDASNREEYRDARNEWGKMRGNGK